MKRHRGHALRVGVPALAVTLGLGLIAPPASAQTVPDDLPWMDASLPPEERAEMLIDAMTLDQKMEQVAMEPVENEDLEGCGFTRIGRHIEPIEELAIPVVRMINGPSGVGGGDCEPDPVATSLPSGIGVAASFNPELAYQWGDIGGNETRGGAHNVFLAPGLNLARVANNGRNFEYFGEDPYLTGVMGVQEVLGIQENNVHANPKHFAFNEQETARRTMSVVVPPRAAHELYLLPFEMAVKDGDAASLMCSFPRIHGTYACENYELLTSVLRDRWGFEGYVFSDRNATMSTVPSIDAGLDLEFPRRDRFSPERLTRYMNSGRISEADLDRMLFNRYYMMFKFGLFDNPVDDYAEIDFDAHGETARAMAAESMVLLKNDGDILPIDANEVEDIALVGPEHFADEAKLGPNSPNINSVVRAPYEVAPEEGLEDVLEELGSDAEVTYTQTDEVSEAVNAAEDADVAIVMVGDLSVEGQDRPTLHLEDPDTYEEGQDGYNVIEIDQEELIEEVAQANENTIVVLKNGGPILMPWWDDVDAVLEAWYPGQEDGHAVADVLLGKVNPSAKLPMSFPNTEREAGYDTRTQFPGDPIDEEGNVDPDPDFGNEDLRVLQSVYTEDLEMGYRWYKANNVEPFLPFGYGLSYTTFAYSNLAVTPTAGATGERAMKVDFTVTNTGDVAGAEAAQLYLGLPLAAQQPSERLVGFDKVYLEPGASERVSITVDSAASNHPFSWFDPAEDSTDPDDMEDTWDDGEWVTTPGTYRVRVGPDVERAPLATFVDLDFPPVVDPPGDGDEGDIPVDVEIPDDGNGEPGDGSLTLTVPDGASVDMGAPTTNADRLRFDGELPAVTVSDTRNDEQAANGGWTVTGRAANFVAGNNQFSSAYLGWIPWADADGRAGVTAGPTVQGQMRGGPGLAQPATLVSATSDGREGDATAGAHLLLEVPRTTPPGDYRSTISLTLFAED